MKNSNILTLGILLFVFGCGEKNTVGNENTGYTVSTNGQSEEVVRLYDSLELHQGKHPDIVHYSRINFEEGMRITVSTNEIQSWAVYGKDSAYQVEKKAQDLIITPEKPQHILLEVNELGRLFLFVEPSIESPKSTAQNVLNIMDFGVDNTGESIVTAQINQALDSVSKIGGTLYFPKGTYQTGTLFIQSNTTVFLEEGAVILGALDTTAYHSDPVATRNMDIPDALKRDVYSRLIYIYSAENVTLTGKGKIDGNGALLRRLKPISPNYHLVRIENSKNINVSNLILQNPRFWTFHTLYSDSVWVENIKCVTEYPFHTTDAFDIDASSNVTVTKGFAYTGDDCFIVKSTHMKKERLKTSENILFDDCTCISGATAMKLGTETVGKGLEMTNITFNDITMYWNKRKGSRAIAIDLRDGLNVRNIHFTNLNIEEANRFLDFNIKPRPGWDGEPGSISEIYLKNIVAERNIDPIWMRGYDSTNSIRNIYFENVWLNDTLVTSDWERMLVIDDFVEGVSFR